MKKVIVTGAGGVLGRAVAANLRTKGYDVVSLAGRNDCNLEIMGEVDEFLARERADFVVHLAAAVYGLGGNLNFPADVFRRNTLINTNVIESSRKNSVAKVVAMGTVAMYSDSAGTPFRELDVMVGQPHSSELFYAFSKRGMLMQLEAYKQQYSMDYAMLLSTNLYGPWDRFDERFGHVIPSLICKFVRGASERGEIEIWGDGSPVRDFLYSDDAAEGVAIVLENGSGLYNLASGSVVTIRHLVEILQREFPGSQVNWNASMPMGQTKREYCVDRLQALGFHPQVSLETGLKKTLEWYKENISSARKYLNA